jgi:phosphohistidine swiveling domain-containing protein
LTGYRWVATPRTEPGSVPSGTPLVASPPAAGLTGLAFTVNPATGATNEIAFQPDGMEQVVLDSTTLRTKSPPTLTTAARATSPHLTDAQSRLIGRLARRVAQHHGGLPRQFAWALEDATVYGVGSVEPVHGDFSWDEDVDDWQKIRENPETIWTLQWANDAWNGATTPLHYSVVARELEEAHVALRGNLGATDMLKLRQFKYWHARAYYNTEVDALHAELIGPPSQRPGMLANVHPDDRPSVLAAPFEGGRLCLLILRQLSDPRSGPNSWMRLSYEYINADETVNTGLGAADLRRLTDLQLTEYTESRVARSSAFNAQMWLGFYTYGPWATQALTAIIQNWLPRRESMGVAETVQELISGLPSPPPIQAVERNDLWQLGDAIRQSPVLDELLRNSTPAEFFDRLNNSHEGREFMERYSAFIAAFGDRGSEDRDLYYPRRNEDPALDWRSFRLIAGSANTDAPTILERRRRERREAITSTLLEQLRAAPLGPLKAAAFTTVVGYVHRFLRLRDDQRHTYDIIAMSKKRAFTEIGRRLADRGLLTGDDIFFLSMPELFDVFLARTSGVPPLVAAKIAGRRNRFRQVYSRSESLPAYIKDGRPYREDHTAPQSTPGPESTGPDAATRLSGLGIGAGRATGQARRLFHLSELDQLRDGDILVCPNADPGWSAAFSVISGLVMEDGRMLSPGACMAREYGLPAVTLPHALTIVPDKTLITIDGGTGNVELADSRTPAVA